MITQFNCSCVAFDWRQTLTYQGIRFSCFPAHHGNIGERLWGSWLIERDNISVYFPGDSAIGPHFQEVRNAVGKPVDLVLMPVGPVCANRHLTAEDAFDMSVVLEAQSVVPIHFGSFGYGPKPPGQDDITEFRRYFQNENNNTLHVLDLGQRVEWNGGRFLAVP
jgi:L-ascorbate metabolism protein UlaG (beta-lactamase superfamily)